ncbi:MAG: hypothetical protein HDT37_07115 [Clostridiales bacterium]|nr:hypothetical protein [Clostridiales bacterium]
MFIVGENLISLVKKHHIIDDIRDVSETCIELKLNHIIKRMRRTNDCDTLNYGERIPAKYIMEESILDEGLILKPQKAVLACSSKSVHIPCGYMGMIQTKGSLARLFVFVHCSDSQVDSGFKGCITFELYNASEFNVRIQAGQKVANLYILPVSDKNVKAYEGKYKDADKPTIQLP